MFLPVFHYKTGVKSRNKRNTNMNKIKEWAGVATLVLIAFLLVTSYFGVSPLFGAGSTPVGVTRFTSILDTPGLRINGTSTLSVTGSGVQGSFGTVTVSSSITDVGTLSAGTSTLGDTSVGNISYDNNGGDSVLSLPPTATQLATGFYQFTASDICGNGGMTNAPWSASTTFQTPSSTAIIGACFNGDLSMKRYKITNLSSSSLTYMFFRNGDTASTTFLAASSTMSNSSSGTSLLFSVRASSTMIWDIWEISSSTGKIEIDMNSYPN